jgi:F0F1-type ATP synthase assembly protein I
MDPAPEEKEDNWRKIVGPYLTMGMELALAVTGMFFIGRWIDGWLETGPWGMYGGLFIGVVGGMIRFIRRALELGALEDAQQEKDEKR